MAGSEVATDRDGQTVTSRGERTAARLRQAAREVFRTAGYAAARVEDIVAQAQVSHGTFYTYYANKANVLDALVDETAARLEDVVSQSWDGPDVEGSVREVISRFLDVFAQEGDVVRTWVEAGAHDERFRERLRGVRRHYIAKVAEQLEPVRARGHDPTVAAGALVAMVEGYAVQRLEAADDEAIAAAVRTLTSLWYGGLLRIAGD